MKAQSEKIEFTRKPSTQGAEFLQAIYVRSSGQEVIIDFDEDMDSIKFTDGTGEYEVWEREGEIFLYSDGNLCQAWPSEELAWVDNQIHAALA